ncbi:hypothetical protein OESDEN_14952 [Oesophagostomum dentatum]|uniref:Histidine acid phosphatase n=1 Tax=Oesophagostomum dentatum TaxID=61180 RepID=A0A0B1SQ44_OESDE|nr:hypothetical protein OESDEN_14952 [Oesophagostomum dentatum]
MWRHGDRSPTDTYKNDPFQEGNWTFGGGGFGQLSPVYVRATDTNRTIVSALSNLVGMFGQQDIGHKPDIDFPSAADWPVGFVPVAVHTLHKPTDYVGHPDADCKRRSDLWKMAMNSDELQEYKKRKDVS